MKTDATQPRRMQAEEELGNYRDRLEELVKNRTAQLVKTQQKAEHASLSKSAFLATICHEIRTPMNAILGLVYLLQEDGLTADQEAKLRSINTAAEHLLSIINDVLDVSKIEAGKLKLNYVNFRISELIDNVMTITAANVYSKGLSMDVEIDEHLDWLWGDRMRLSQALLNYTSNAVKFTEQGKISLRVTLQTESVDDFLVRFEVEDTGVGIEAASLDQLFHPFTQVGSSAMETHIGSGLGLAVNRRLAELMEGEVGAESVLGQGSTFWFTAKVGRVHKAQIIVRDEASKDAQKLLCEDFSDAHILLVDDNELNLDVSQALFEKIGLQADTAKNGQQALDKAQENLYDIVLMDVQMPVMDGLQATRSIRSLDGYADIPILAMTANAFSEDRQICIEAGMNDYVPKPIRPGFLYATIFKWLSKMKAKDRGRK